MAVSDGAQSGSIITVGLSPCWDIACSVDGADWGDHAELNSQVCIPAGKALNVSKALAWFGATSTATGLWGKSDYQQMLESMERLSKFVRVRFTVVDGRTRQNITIVDTAGDREMHLRATSELATRSAILQLKQDVGRIVGRGDVCVFAGGMPGGELLEECVSVVDTCRCRGGRIVVDGSGAALRRIVEEGGIWMIKPNLAELSELLGRAISDEPRVIVQAAKELLGRVEIVLVSRGENGAVVVCRDNALQGMVENGIKAVSTVGCGDYLLAGFLDGFMRSDDISFALGKGLKAGGARAFGWSGRIGWSDAEKRIEASVLTIG